MSNQLARRMGGGLLTPGSQMPQRKGFGIARSGGQSWNSGQAVLDREDVNDALLGAFMQQPNGRQRAATSRRSYAKVRWAYEGLASYASCVDLSTGLMLTNGEDPERRCWRLEPRRDERDEPIKNPDESQLAPIYRFLESPHPSMTFEQLLRPIAADFIAANAVNAEVALHPDITNDEGIGVPGALYLLPQIEIFPKVDARGELDRVTPFVQLRHGVEPTFFTWPQSLYATDGYMRGASVNPQTPVDSIMTQVRTIIDSMKFVESYFTSGAKMGLTFRNDDWKEEEALEFLTWLEGNFLGVENGHRPFVLYGGLTMEDLPQNVHEFAQYIEIMRASVNAVCSRFRTDPRLIYAESQGSALGNKGERQHVWNELLHYVNQKKRSFSRAFTDRIIHKGFGALDWEFTLVPTRNLEDAERMAQVASAFKVASEAGFVTYDFAKDVRVAREQFHPELADLTDDEIAEHFGPAPVPPAPFTGQQPAPEPVGEKEGGEAPEPVKPPANSKLPMAPGGGGPEALPAGRAKRKIHPDAKPLVAAMDDWTTKTSSAIAGDLLASIDKGIDALSKLYEEAAKDGFSDALKTKFSALNLLPKAGIVAADFRKALKAHYQVARKMALAEMKAAERAARATGGGPGGVDNWIEAFGEQEFDDVYSAITKAMRRTFIQGLRAGWSGPEFVAQIKAKAPELAKKEVERVVRTASTDIMNIGRQHVAEESGDVVAYRYMAIVEPERTCELCMEADGLEIGIHDPDADRLRPPSHPNCRCMYSFIRKGEEWETDQAQISRVLSMLSEDYGGKLSGG